MTISPAAAAVTQAEGLASFVLGPAGTDERLDLLLRVIAQDAYDERDLLCLAFPCAEDGSLITGRDSSWARSKSLGSLYAYLPAFEGPAFVPLRPFRLNGGFDSLILVVRGWRREVLPGELVVDACMRESTVLLGSGRFPAYRVAGRFDPRANGSHRVPAPRRSARVVTTPVPAAPPEQPAPPVTVPAAEERAPLEALQAEGSLGEDPRGVPPAEETLLWVDPAKVNLVFGGPGLGREERIALKKRLLAAEPGVLSDNWDEPSRQRFTELEVYEALEARLVQGRPWRETGFYQRLLKDFEAGRMKWGCANEDQLAGRLLAVEELYRSIQRDGYKTQAELSADGRAEEVRLAIRRDGRFLFVDGRHRLAIARLLGIPKVPVKIAARHEEWEAFRDEVDGYAANHNGQIYQVIDHPDLEHVPAAHRTDRIEMLRAALEGYDATGKKLLDIGTHWGYMCQQMERVGFDCTGLELLKTNAAFAERIRDATESSYEIWQGNVFDYPDPEGADVVLALSIFHHFLKTERDHERLIAFLGRLDADVIMFEPHRHDPPAQMEGAFRNYSPDEFVEFVMRHAGMTESEFLGNARDGRPLFKLSRR